LPRPDKTGERVSDLTDTDEKSFQKFFSYPIAKEERERKESELWLE